MKNLSNNDLNRFIDKRLTDFRKSTIQYQQEKLGFHKTLDAEGYLERIEDEQNGINLKRKLNDLRIPRKVTITNQTNFRDIENPFGNYSLTL